MGLQAAVGHAISGVVERVRRDAIGYAVVAVSGIAILILATWAAVLSLIPVVGAVYAPLIVAGIFVLVIVATMIWLQMANAPRQPRAQPAAASPLNVSADPAQAQRQAQFAQVAMIIEAVMLGYSMSRKR
jgi:threonine/homoserine/homoserine lactone efflux protein